MLQISNPVSESREGSSCHEIVDVTRYSKRLVYRTSIHPTSGFVFCQLSNILCLLSAPWLLTPCPFHSHHALLKLPSYPQVKYDLLRRYYVSNKMKNTVLRRGWGGYKRTRQIMLALHALVRKSRYQTPLPTYCNWGDCEALSQGQDDCGGRKAVLCAELNGDGALHSYRASTEDRVIQPNEVLQHTSSPCETWLSAPGLKGLQRSLRYEVCKV